MYYVGHTLVITDPFVPRAITEELPFYGRGCGDGGGDRLTRRSDDLSSTEIHEPTTVLPGSFLHGRDPDPDLVGVLSLRVPSFKGFVDKTCI